tara:strand:- start:371 stop:496 length:126 start_codon:yes stop_codon:yes gene_type:complete
VKLFKQNFIGINGDNIPYFIAVFSGDVFKFEYIYIKLKPSL